MKFAIGGLWQKVAARLQSSMRRAGLRSQLAKNGNVDCVQGSTVNVGERDSQRFLASLQKTESSAGRYPPGSLLLAQDPNDLNRCPYAT